MESHILYPEEAHTASIIWLHGLGADGYDFAPVAEELGLLKHGVKFIFPHAPVRPITFNMGFEMRGWYDIITLDRDNFIHDVEGIEASSRFVHQLVEEELRLGIPASNIILVGFSQGGAIALYAGLTDAHSLGGIVALSTYLPAPDVLHEKRTLFKPPILMQHGTEDIVILPAYAELSYELLREMGYAPELDFYPIGHTIDRALLDRIQAWIFGILRIQLV
ncbi:MAG: alpha/beta fold hydrolase [Gammaproteobacteria bacterium]|jgi:phospholipase/carboxylesterase|nr:alpha/beta fold hydrolase [Gammaproteobacteria bacterium]